jgi:hypothetical protein
MNLDPLSKVAGYGCQSAGVNGMREFAICVPIPPTMAEAGQGRTASGRHGKRFSPQTKGFLDIALVAKGKQNRRRSSREIFDPVSDRNRVGLFLHRTSAAPHPQREIGEAGSQ